MTDRILTASRHVHASGTTVLTLTGDLDYHTAPQLGRAVEETPLGPDNNVVIDLTDLAYCDSTGLTALITAYKQATGAGARLVLAAPSAELLRVFAIVGLDQLFTYQPTADDAVKALGPHDALSQGPLTT
ncbi:STAS domain-containing protein [Streptodolium elevatio]|uniref:Anti-sigma factor antagonist n=1 Tax=Streptodolium elevatio TaxID=3157996 RepID=A0ABV3DVQ2_9ACTN